MSNLEEEEQAYLSAFGLEVTEMLKQVLWFRPTLYRMTLIWFQLPCLETHPTNPSTSVFVLLPSLPVLILMFRSLSLYTFQPRMPISSTHLLASHTITTLSHSLLCYRNTSPDAPRSAPLLPALPGTHLPEVLHKATCH